MRVVSKRMTKLERSRQSEVRVKKAYEGKPKCGCGDGICQDERWIQLVEGDEGPQRMILDSQVADVSKPLLAVKRIVEKGKHSSVWSW
eukprot:10688019-Karenia_brevis.AAC.1